MKYPFRGFSSPLGARNSKSFGGPPDELDRWIVRYRFGMFKALHRMRQRPWRLVGILLIICMLATVWFIPMPDETEAVQTVHTREATLMTGLQKICDHPQQVFQHFNYPLAKVPTQSILSLLPKPAAVPLLKQGDMTYDPVQNILCTVGGRVFMYVMCNQPKNEHSSLSCA
ncbi:hypothetical protein [Dictyobacter kobayashii]|uniref:Uncharacterized protein n=1 Tax=Dictyobacter kobayashii TaxID=2014872 RepID=A0A402AWH3_9CHLR|nr:hypothetical protein [Dictyobacter kobayashii]GCE23456.1 hypothetical protein KDK_72560 [Dictyobacter kobayashii]